MRSRIKRRSPPGPIPGHPRPCAVGAGCGPALLLCLGLLLSGCRSAPEEPRPWRLQKAREASQRAGELARQGRWPASAIAWEEAASQQALLNRRAEEAAARRGQAFALLQVPDLQAARVAARQALALSPRETRPDAWWRAQVILLQIDAAAGEAASVTERLERLLPQAKSIASPATRALFLNEAGLWQLRQDQPDSALATFGAAVEGFWRAHQDAQMATALANRARAHEAVEQWEAAARDWEASLRLFMQQGQAHGIATALLGQARTLFHQGQSLDRARELALQAAGNFARLDDPAGERAARDVLERIETTRPTAAGSPGPTD